MLCKLFFPFKETEKITIPQITVVIAIFHLSQGTLSTPTHTHPDTTAPPTMCTWSSKQLDKIGMVLVFSPNWFLGLFHQAGHRTQVSSSLSDTLHSQIYGHLQAGCGFCKQNLLHQQCSMHQQTCLANTAYTYMQAQKRKWTECNADSRREGESYYTSCLFC